jgi:hypothetical protein
MEDAMTRIWKLFAIGALAAAVGLAIVPAASASPRVFIGARFGPGFYGPGWWGPGWYGWYGPAYYGPYSAVPATGTVKIETKIKDASVYVDNGFAGMVQHLKSFPLKPGTHAIELRDPSGHMFFQQQVNVLAGKTVKVYP